MSQTSCPLCGKQLHGRGYKFTSAFTQCRLCAGCRTAVNDLLDGKPAAAAALVRAENAIRDIPAALLRAVEGRLAFVNLETLIPGSKDAWIEAVHLLTADVLMRQNILQDMPRRLLPTHRGPRKQAKRLLEDAHRNLHDLQKPGKIADCRQYLIERGFSPEEELSVSAQEEIIPDLADFETRCPVCGLRQYRSRTTCAVCGAALKG